MEFRLNESLCLGAAAISETVFRVSIFPHGTEPGSALDRYGFQNSADPLTKAEFAANDSAGELVAGANRLIIAAGDKPQIELSVDNAIILSGRLNIGRGEDCRHSVEFDLSENERLFGLGDQTRDRIEHRGSRARMWVSNVSSYIPIPFLMSSRGYGIFVNTTSDHRWDLGKDDPGKLRITVPGKSLDIYLFCASDPKALLSAYTDITGKPDLPPKWSFGLWFVCRNFAGDHQVLDDALNFRDRALPCDVISLEPGWMQEYYDYSTDKKWHKERFSIPSYNVRHSFISALKRMGFKFSLWLCNDYDLSYEAERRTGGAVEGRKNDWDGFSEDDTEQDAHFTAPTVMDKITKPEEPWFEHLKKFVDQGADMFKQDGALQVTEHPDRLWGNGMSDKEMHNLYPLLYSQQMYEGFKEHTGRRPCCFTAAGWAGLQRYTGTWTGDTGGEAKTLVACLNLALSGHSNVTCDMEVTTREGIHYGFLMTWAQVNSWNYFRHPWLLGDELYPVFRDYDHLRSRLIPYLYTYAYEAHKTGIPVMRPMALEFPEATALDDCLTQYCLGREFLVTAFTDTVRLPAGKWYDYWTKQPLAGPVDMVYNPPQNRGGGLFVRANSIIPLGPVKDYVGQKSDQGMSLEIYLEENGEASFTMYDDDGVSFDYRQGAFNLYRFKAGLTGGSLHLEIPSQINIGDIAVYTENSPDKAFLNGTQISFEQTDNALVIRNSR
ncbi:MAG: glycoside hydrolase family 31 protein [bacterium]|nr:glycoside hydrolase family 31 protein [bacterium]